MPLSRPRQVMVYSIDRKTPCTTLSKVPREELEAVARRIRQAGFDVTIA